MHNGMHNRVLAVFTSASQAESVVDQLIRRGIKIDTISKVEPDSVAGHAMLDHEATHAPDGAVTGSAIGATASASAMGIAAAAGLITTGPLVLILGALVAGGAAGGLLGALMGFGIPESEGEHVAKSFAHGAVMVAVECHSESEEELAQEIMGAAKPTHAFRVENASTPDDIR